MALTPAAESGVKGTMLAPWLKVNELPKIAKSSFEEDVSPQRRHEIELFTKQTGRTSQDQGHFLDGATLMTYLGQSSVIMAMQQTSAEAFR